MKTAQHIYDTAVKNMPRSPEWKSGALAGLKRREFQHLRQPSPFRPASAQDDAWRAGVQYGLDLWVWNQEEFRL